MYENPVIQYMIQYNEIPVRLPVAHNQSTHAHTLALSKFSCSSPFSSCSEATYLGVAMQETCRLELGKARLQMKLNRLGCPSFPTAKLKVLGVE